MIHVTESLRSHYPKAEIFCFGWKFFSRPLHMKELNLLFPTIPNLSIFIWEKSWNNRFENTWVHIGPVYSPCIFKSIVSTFFLYENWQVWYRWKEEIQLFHMERSRKELPAKTKNFGLRVVAPFGNWNYRPKCWTWMKNIFYHWTVWA